MASSLPQGPEPETTMRERTPLERTIEGLDSTNAAALS